MQYPAENQFRDIIENSQEGVWLTDGNHCIVYANPAMAAIAGIGVDQIVGRSALDGFSEETLVYFRSNYRAAVVSDKPIPYECKTITPAGRAAWLGGWLTPMRENGVFSGMVCTVQDITARKSTDEVLAFLTRIGGAPADEPFFPALARFLAESLGMFYVCIDRLEGDGLNARTLAVWCDGNFDSNVTYALKDTPCGEVIGQEVCCFPSDVCERFPRDPMLRDLGAQSYVGVTLWSHTGQPIGLIAVIGRTPMVNRQQAEVILKLIALRAAGELERMVAAEALQASEIRFRTLLDTIPSVAVQGYGPGGTTHYWNQASEQLYGYTAGEAIGRNVLDLIIPPEKREIVRRAIERSFETGRPIPAAELSLVRKDGAQVDVFSSHACIQVPGQEPEMFCVDVDLTERKRAEQELRIAAIAFEAQEGMMVTDADCRILRVNRAFATITGYLPEDVIGQNPRLLQSGMQDANFYAAMWERLGRTGGWEGEIWNRRKSGDIFPEWLTIAAVKDETGEITNYVATFTDITFRKETEDQIRYLAFYDPLTHLPNRRLMLDRLGHALTSSARHHQHGALILIDLDNFKTLNDTLGHDVGDQLLVEVASRLESCIREGDTVARLGGDEFVVIVEDLDGTGLAAMQAESVARKIQVHLSQPYLLDLSLVGDQLNKRSHHCTSSIGITLFRDHPVTIDELMKRADTAMYQAKAAGRNTLRFFDPDMQAVVAARAALEVELRKAITEEQFLLHYQAQVDSVGRVVGAEALLHWKHPVRGLISPVEYIPLAEAAGLIQTLGQWVMETACHWLWRGRA